MSTISIGKRRQLSQSSEQTPLLPSSTDGRGPLLDDSIPTRNGFSTLSIALFTFFVSLSLVLVAVHLYTGTLISRNLEISYTQIAEKGFQIDAIKGIRFSNEEEKVGVEIDVKLGFDLRAGLEWQNPTDWVDRISTWAAKKIIKQVQSTEINYSSLTLSSVEPLIRIQSDSINLPLSYGHLLLQDRTIHSTVEILNPPLLGAFLKSSWEKQAISMEALVEGVNVELGNGWNKWISAVQVPSISRILSQKIPKLGNASSLIEISNFSLLPSPIPDSLLLLAAINLTNPLPQLSWANPYKLPFNIHLPMIDPSNSTEGRILLAQVDVSPFGFKSETQKEIILAGKVLFPLEDAKIEFEKSLSSFVKAYLAGEDSTVYLSYDSTSSVGTVSALNPPKCVSEMLAGIEIPFEFPGSTSKLEFFRDLKIEKMKISLAPSSSLTDITSTPISTEENVDEPDLFCSGTITGELLLPTFLSSLSPSLYLTQILPDLLIYSGAPSPNSDNNYPPTPFPINSFARLHPNAKISTTTIHSSDGTIHFRAEVKEAPLFLLRGREAVFQNYMRKLLLSGGRGVETGIRGISSVEVRIGEEVNGGVGIGLEGIQLEGKFLVGG